MKRYLFLMICCFIAVNGMSQTFRIGGVSRDSIAIFGLKNNILKLGIIADTVPISKKIVIENISEEPIDLYSIIPTKGCLKFNYQKGKNNQLHFRRKYVPTKMFEYIRCKKHWCKFLHKKATLFTYSFRNWIYKYGHRHSLGRIQQKKRKGRKERIRHPFCIQVTFSMPLCP